MRSFVSFKIKDSILFKLDPDKMGVFFSVEDQSDKYLRLNGVASEFLQKMVNGTKFKEARMQILEEYDVSEQVLDSDLAILEEKLKEAEFLLP